MKFTSILRSLASASVALVLCAILLSVVIFPTQAQTRAYVASSCNGQVSVIETRTNSVVVNIPAGNEPLVPAATADGSRVYVTNHGDGTVTAIDTAINQPVSTIPVAVFPYGIATTPDNTRAYVASPLSKVISVIDTNSNAVVHVIPEPRTPFQLAITPDGTRAYVTNGAGLVFGTTVSVVNLLTNTVTVDNIGVAITPSGIAITPDGKRAYVPNANSAILSVIDTENNVGLRSIILWFGISGVAISHDGAKVYVANPDNGTVSVIDTSTNEVTATIQFPLGRRPKFLALTPDDSRVYVTSGGASTTPDTNGIDIIDTVSNTLTTSIPMFDYCPAGIAIVNLVPHNNDDCRSGGYKKYDFPTFPNQGQCQKYVREHAN